MAPKRLQQCLKAKSAVALFPLLRDWTAEQLTELLAEIEAFSEAKDSEIVEAWKHDIFQPECFFNDGRSAIVTEARDKARIAVLAVCSEIASVALFYLRDKANREAQ